MILMPETSQEPRHKFSALTTLAVVLAAFLLAAAAYVCWQAAHILFPQNVYETALPITISDTIEAVSYTHLAVHRARRLPHPLYDQPPQGRQP